ncbi:MAG TPA: hypothetical protein DIS79_04650 [Bacteroidetes bacterium]|nr:hypothetical protein [Bacteroidota bacterium]
MNRVTIVLASFLLLVNVQAGAQDLVWHDQVTNADTFVVSGKVMYVDQSPRIYPDMHEYFPTLVLVELDSAIKHESFYCNRWVVCRMKRCYDCIFSFKHKTKIELTLAVFRQRSSNYIVPTEESWFKCATSLLKEDEYYKIQILNTKKSE